MFIRLKNDETAQAKRANLATNECSRLATDQRIGVLGVGYRGRKRLFTRGELKVHRRDSAALVSALTAQTRGSCQIRQ